MARSTRLKKQKLFGRKISIALAFDLFVLAVIATVFTANSQIFAANHAITGGTNGPLCNSGGYFTPSSLTIASGDTVTISVPSNDPYAGGLEVHGFPEGNFTIARGGQHTTQALTSNVSYYGTWPSTGCMKGSGTITVTHPSPPPPSPSPTPPSPSPSPTPNPTPTPAASTTPKASSQHTTSAAKTKTHTSATKKTSEATASGADQSTAAPNAQAVTLSATNTKTMTSTPRKVVGITSIVAALGIFAWIAWQLFVKRKKI